MREIIGARLKEERERLGYSQLDFAAVGGASKRSQIDWEQGKLVPNAEFLALVASELGVDVLYVLTGSHSKDKINSDEDQILSGYRKLDLRGKAGVLALIDGMNASTGAKNQNSITGTVTQAVQGDQTVHGPINFTVGAKNAKE